MRQLNFFCILFLHPGAALVACWAPQEQAISIIAVVATVAATATVTGSLAIPLEHVAVCELDRSLQQLLHRVVGTGEGRARRLERQ